ncbi:hypothetical protein Tco_1170612 [Tanacetum coccineum]
MSGSSLNSRFIVDDNCANIVAVHLHWLFITGDDSKPINELLNPNSFLCSFRSVAMHLDSLEDIAISLFQSTVPPFIQTAKTRKNPGKRFVTCSKCNVYNFLDDDLPSEYYKELLYGMLQKHKQSRLEEELKATKSKLKLYDRCYGSNVMVYILLLCLECKCKCKLQMLACNLQMLACKCKLQLQEANASCKYKQMGKQPANASCNWKLQLQDAITRCKCKLQLQDANASSNCKLQMLTCKCKLQLQAANASFNCKKRMQSSIARSKLKLQLQAANCKM